MFTPELQLVIGVCIILVTVVWLYKAITTQGIPGANAELTKLRADVQRLDHMENVINTIRNQSPQHEMLISTFRTLTMDITRTLQQVQLEAFRIGLVIPFDEQAAKLLENINKTVDVLTDQLPNTPPNAGITG